MLCWKCPSTTKQERIWSGIVWKHVILLWTSAPSYALAHNYCYCHAYLSSSRLNFFLLWCHIRKKKIWKIFRKRGLAMRWKMFWKIIINIWYISRSTNNDLVMFRPIHINSSQLLCACQKKIYIKIIGKRSNISIDIEKT